MAFVTENLFLIIIALVSGGMLLWPTIAGRAAAGVGLDPLGATRLMNDQKPTVIDLRDAADFDRGHLINAKNIPADQLESRAGELSAKRPVLLYCGTGSQSGRAASKLRSDGREDIYSLTGGIAAWSQASLPVVKQ